MRWRAKPTKVEGDRPPTRKGPKSGDAQVRDLEKRLAEALKRESEAAEQQSATSEILRVISRSPTDLQPVLDTVVASAARYCGAYDATMLRLDEGSLRLAAHHGPIPIPVGRPIPVVRGTTSGRAVLERRAVHVADIQVEAGEFPESGAFAKELGYRTQLSVPLLREGAAIGTIVLRRIEMNPFTDTQIALLETFADQAVIAIENVRLFNETKEALEQQTATSEILRVISSSPTDVQPVLDAVTRSASRLCEANDAGVWLRDDETLVIRAHNGPIPMPAQRIPISRDWVTGRAVLDGRPIHVDNLATAGEEFPEGQAMALRDGHRTTLAIPLVREGKAIGAILIRRTEVRPFSDKHIALLKTFADQAVIAMENVRLFNETKEALEQQTATSEILRVISSSPTDVQPVFETIAANALRLCAAKLCTVFRFDGTLIHLVALDQVSTEGAAAYRDAYPAPPGRGGGTHRAILTRSIVHIPDIREDPEYELQALARANDFGCVLSVPMLRDGQPVGAITVGREAGRAFPDEQIELLKTFADQALIAIENVRLFNETKEALEQQTATSEVLKVISRSAFDLESVLETLIENAVRLCGASRGSVYRVDGNLLRHAISYNVSRDTADFFDRNPLAPGRYSIAARVALERRTQHIPDILVDSEYTFGVHQVEPIRTALGVPMMKGDRLIGAFTIWKLEVQPFTDRQIELVTTFADQAVIAIENVRLFTELQARTAELTRSVGELTALGEVSQALSSTLDLEAVLNTIVSRASQLAGAAGCSIYEYDEAAERFELRATHNPDSKFVEALRAAPLRKGEGVMGRATEMREPIQISDIAQPGAYQSSVRDILLRFGYRALLSVPLLREDQIIGSLSFNRKAPGEFPPEVVDVLKTFATQSALAIQNARLFHEIADKSRQLEVASQHKSEFLANMSHELRTPLNAILGFSEVLAQGMFGPVNEKQTEYLNDILESGRHLLSLINDILDLSKIEAGRMELELSEFDLPQAIQNALTLVRERALRRGIALHHAIDDRLAAIRADERKVKQVLLNLLSNAVKFTPEGGRIEVRAAPADGKVEVSVTDTGIGIASEDLETVFEEFRQVGTADEKAEGTGLGLALARKFIELHGGRIWVKSEPGRGSTFTFTLPVTRD